MTTQPMHLLPGNFHSRLVIFGAGGLGRKMVRGLGGIGIRPLKICDNNAQLWGQRLEDIEIVPPKSAVEAFPEAVFTVSIWHPSKHEGLCRHEKDLRALGCREVFSFISFFWMYPEIFLPNLFWQQPGYFSSHMPLINAARELLDDLGKEEFDRQLSFRLSGDCRKLQDPDPGLQYFPEEIISLRENETFVDCGAFDGDTVRDFMAVSGGRFKQVIAFEPDPVNIRQLLNTLDDSRVHIHPYAVGAKREVLRMSSSGASSSFNAQGEHEVQCVTLDELLANESPTFIKMDIEGSEIDALHGATATIRRCSPKIAACVYHHPDHLWQIPLLLKHLLPDSRLTLRSHMLDGFDTVCYCLPNA